MTTGTVMDDEEKKDRTYLDTSDGMAYYAKLHGAKCEKESGRWYVDGDVPPDLLGLIPKQPNKPVYITAPSCPTCGGHMVQRSGKKGPFWGCARYPRCHGTVDYEAHLDNIDNVENTRLGSVLSRQAQGPAPKPKAPQNTALPAEVRAEAERVVTLAIPLRGGDRQAQKWLTSPMVRFKGKTPLEVMTTVEGCRAVEDHLVKSSSNE